jgi:ATP-dependent helicase/nuclease subunit A
MTCLDWIGPAVRRKAEPAAPHPIEVTVWGTEDGNPVPAPGARTAEDQELPSTMNKQVYDEVKRRLEWRYGPATLTTTFAKMSVGELRRRMEGEEDDAWKADDLEDSRFSLPHADLMEASAVSSSSPPLKGAARGIAVHALLSRMRLGEGGSLDGVRREAERLLDMELMESPGLDERDIRRVAEFLATPDGKSLLAAPASVRREVPFTLKVPAGMSTSDDNVVIQGVIDVMLDEGDGLVIFDYKTDEADQELQDLVDGYFNGMVEPAKNPKYVKWLGFKPFSTGDTAKYVLGASDIKENVKPDYMDSKNLDSDIPFLVVPRERRAFGRHQRYDELMF